MNQQTLDRLKNVFKEVFVDDYEITENTTADDIEEWDSMAQINLVKALEDEFKVSLDLNEISDLENIGALGTLLEKKSE